jgi:energy-coupling factor transporter transmembrane protein EcfT
MTTLIFLLTVLSLLVLLIILLTKAISSKPFKQLLKSIAIILFGYFTIWLVFYLTAKPLVVPLGTDVCFDDWCASITQIEKSTEIQR